MKADAISIVEAAYDCESDSRSWFRHLLEKVSPKLDRGFGVQMATYAPNMRPEELTFETHGMAREWEPRFMAAIHAMIAAYPHFLHTAFSPTAPSLAPHGTTTSALGLTVDQARGWAPFIEYMHPLGVQDNIGVLSRDPSGHVIFITAPSPDLRRPSRPEVATWSRIATHISAGARLRRAFSAAPTGDLSEGADVVLSPSGSVKHAEVGAQSPNAIESVRRAAKAIDRARSKARSNEDEALDLWQGLVAGRWSRGSRVLAALGSRHLELAIRAQRQQRGALQ
jgi:hypothetical protein